MVGLHKRATKVDKGTIYCALQHRTKIRAGREMGREEEGNDVFFFGGGGEGTRRGGLLQHIIPLDDVSSSSQQQVCLTVIHLWKGTSYHSSRRVGWFLL